MFSVLSTAFVKQIYSTGPSLGSIRTEWSEREVKKKLSRIPFSDLLFEAASKLIARSVFVVNFFFFARSTSKAFLPSFANVEASEKNFFDLLRVPKRLRGPAAASESGEQRFYPDSFNARPWQRGQVVGVA